jgi:transcriptional regulator with XRE-family HTH domain
MAPPVAMSVATSGVPGLDSVLGGLLRGDNVIWSVEGAGSAEPFYRAASATCASFDQRLYITLTEAPDQVSARFGDVVVVDARPGGPLGRPAAVLDHVHRRSREGRCPLVLFDPVEAMLAAWGVGLTSRFIARCSVTLLELNAVSYWSVRVTEVPGRLYRQTQAEAQCALVVEGDRVRITKAEGHPASATGSVLSYAVAEGLPTDLHEAPVAQRLGAALRAVRQRRHLTQQDLGRAAGVSASAISQAERGHRGLSFGTLLELTQRLGMSFEELLDGRTTQLAHRVGRRREWSDGAPRLDRLLPADEHGRSVSVVRLPAGGSFAPQTESIGSVVVIVASGVLEVVSDDVRCVLRAGDVMAISGTGVAGLRDLGAGSTVFLTGLGDAPGR